MALKNPNGYGSITNMGKGRRRPFRVVITVGWKKGDDGEYIQDRRTLGYYATRKEAMYALADYNQSPFNIDGRKTTFAEIWEVWKNKGYNGLSKSAHKSYDAAFKRLHSLHNMLIGDIKTIDLQAILDDASAKGASQSTLTNLKMVMSRVFAYAMEHELIKRDCSQYIKMPKCSAASDIHHPYTDAEVALLWEHVNDAELHTSVACALIMIYTGMRPSELRLIKAADVHLDEHYMIGGIKTQASKNRVIPLHDDILNLVCEFYKSSDGDQEKRFLMQRNGREISVAFLESRLKDLEKINIKHLPHDCRHTFATAAKRSKLDDFYIAKILGHTLDTITQKVYTHVTPSDLVREVNKIKFF